jgi:two-component system, OmpR family, response regulator
MGKDIKLLIVEDDINLSYLMKENFEAKGFEVNLAKTGREGISFFQQQVYDICILDVMLPEIDGWRVAHKLKSIRPKTPFIFLTARGESEDKLKGFEIGADDYITKPFNFKELYYRILVILKRLKSVSHELKPEVIRLENLILNTEQRTIRIADVDRKLSRKESDVLALLLNHLGRFISKSEILIRVWGSNDIYTGKSLDVYLSRIRKILKDAPQFEIENLYGTGYRIIHTNTLNK